MTELSFLDELATQNTDNASTTENTESAPQVGPDTSVPVAVDTTSKYPNVIATYDTLEEATANEGKLHTASEFSALLTVRNVTERNMGIDGIVKDSAVSTALRAVRHPLSVVLVGETAYLTDNAFTEWDNRPVRGEGATTGGGRLSDDDLLKAAATARDSVDSLTRRLDSLKTRLSKATTLVAKRERQMSERFTTDSTTSLWERVDAWVTANEPVLADADTSTDGAESDADTEQAA